MTTTLTTEQQEALDELRRLLPPGATVHTILRHVSRSGMSRAISPVLLRDGKSPFHLTGLVSHLPGMKRSYDGIEMGGCGMDMGSALVYDLSRRLYPNGFSCIGESCPSNDHSNDYGAFSHAYDNQHAPKDDDHWYVSAQSGFYGGWLALTPKQREERTAYREAKGAAWDVVQADLYAPSRTHSDGGYALRQRWL